MRLHTFKAFQHLVTFDQQTAIFKIKIRQHRAPDGMGVHYSAGSSLFDNPYMQRAFV